MDEAQLRALKARAGEAIERQADALRDISLYLLAHPELGYAEHLAAARLTEYLQRHGFQVERGIGGLPTAFRATCDSGRPGPTIAFLAEYDALPDVGHGCGHNLIAVSALAAGVGAQAALGELSGKIVVLGTPAEEFQNQMEGKVRLLEAGAFAGVDACLMLHPWTRTLGYNGSLAFVALDLVFRGHTAHAAADPWNGRNALDAVIMTFNAISALRQHVQPDVRIHGIVTEGGVAPNIIPERAAARFMVRARTRARVDALLERVRACAQGAALATGTQLEIAVIGAASDVVPYPTLQAVTYANFAALGIPIEPPEDSSGSTDFGDVTHVMPSDSFHITLDAGDMPWHSRQVAEAAGQEPALRSTLKGATVLAMDAIDLLANPHLLEKARREMPAYHPS
jgi:amidohydrolase